ncbi:conserved hypothetical Ustilago-specific protein [Sporisorium reilianum SRZ2]|uniref:Conserved hypothetical Ustilago-specific protein n=1 Tax=Sporisorium reilianum (strain SRZ2) TaxID=999809 RepID=E6ZZZ3_SPORE|nr:conserved hypothetical Ustilago-specific protein [Sporisorium reilianum SRZ2]
MISVIRLIAILAFASLGVTVWPFQVDEEDNHFRNEHHQFIKSTFPPHMQEAAASVGICDHYPHLRPAHCNRPNEPPSDGNLEELAWKFSHTDDHGPIRVSSALLGPYVYVTTKIPGDSILGRQLGLGVNLHDEHRNLILHDLYAFWRIGADQSHNLLSLHMWPRGGNTPQITHW